MPEIRTSATGLQKFSGDPLLTISDLLRRNGPLVRAFFEVWIRGVSPGCRGSPLQAFEDSGLPVKLALRGEEDSGRGHPLSAA